MPDIFFKCEACGRHFVADDAAAGTLIPCPECNESITIPEIASAGKCPRCRYRLKFSPDMRAESVHCPACHGELRLPGQRYPRVCPKCGVGWVPPLHHCQCCSYSMDDAGIPLLLAD